MARNWRGAGALRLSHAGLRPRAAPAAAPALSSRVVTSEHVDAASEAAQRGLADGLGQRGVRVDRGGHRRKVSGAEASTHGPGPYTRAG